MLNLSGVYAKIDRAYEHLDALDGETQTWVRRYPYALYHEVKNEGAEHIGILEVYRPPSDPRFGILIGDCVHNLRFALDHLVFVIARTALTQGELARRENLLVYPICLSFAEWDKALKRNRLAGVSDAVRSEIDARQPYHSSNPATEELAVLSWLNNRDKHRLLHTVAAYPQPRSIHFSPELPAGSTCQIAEPPIDHGTQVIRALTPEPSPDLQLRCDMIAEIHVQDAPVDEDIRTLLLRIGQTVQRVLAKVYESHP